MKKKEPYTSAYYNRLVKVADGIDDHDVVVMEQLKQYAEKDASNIGKNLTVTPVYQTDNQGNIKLGNDNKPLIDKEKTEQKRKDAQTTNKNDWGDAIGTGKIADPDASDKKTNGSQQLVTGGTVYKALNGGMTKIVIGTPGENGKDGAPGTIGLVGPAGADGKNAEVDITIQQGKDDASDASKGVKGANGVDGKDGITRIVYKDAAGDHQVATMEDGLKFAGDDGQNDATKAIAKKLNNTVDIIGGADSTKLTANNIGVNNVDGKLKIQLAQELTGITSISGSTDSKGAKITLDTNDQNISVNGGKITDVASGLSTNDGSYNAKDANNTANISDVNSMISKAVTDAKGETQQDLDKKANVDASNIGTNLKGADGKTAATEDEQKANLDKWGKAIGTGEVKEGSKQLVTGGTVYSEVRPSKDGAYVKMSQTTGANLIALDNQVQTNTDKLSVVDSRSVKYDTKTVNDKTVVDNTKITLAGDGGTTITNLKDGALSDSSTDAVTGKQLYAEQQARDAADTAINNKLGTLDANGNYIQKDASVSSNLNTLDTQVKANADAVSKEKQDREAAITNITNNIGNLSDSAVKYDADTNKTKITLAGEGGTTITNLKDGALSDSSTDAVTGKQLYVEQQAREAADTAINNKIGTLDANGNYIQKDSSISSNLSTLDTQVKTNADAISKNKSDIQSLKDSSSTINTKLETKADKDLSNITDKGKQVIKDTMQADMDKKANVDASNIETSKWAEKLGTGKVSEGDRNLVTGDTVNTAIRESEGRNPIQSDGKTLTIGSKDTATKVDISGKDANGNKTGRVITGVVSDANDPNSAANVGYVNGITAASNEQIYRDMNMQYNHVENDISRAAAGSNALAALHPMQEFDPDDKAQFALGYGHYRNSNAGAVGAFYQPDENSLFSFGVSFGNGDAGLNAGVTFKFGPGGSDHHALTKTQMAKVIDAQSKEIDALKKDNADKDKRIDALEQKVNEILAKVEKDKA